MSKAPRSFSYYDLLDAGKEPGCPLCRIGQSAAARHLEGMIFSSVNSVSLREKLRNSLGYCNEHTWHLPEAGESAPLGIAIIHRDLLNTINKQLDDISFKKSRRRSLKAVMGNRTGGSTDNGNRYLRPTAKCPACERRDEMERLAFRALQEALETNDERIINTLKQSDGLCVPHLRHALEIATNETAFAQLIQITQDQLNVVIQELDEYIRKRDHRFREEEINMAEGVSWQKAMGRMVGASTDSIKLESK